MNNVNIFFQNETYIYHDAKVVKYEIGFELF